MSPHLTSNSCSLHGAGQVSEDAGGEQAETNHFADLWGAAGFDDAPVVDKMGLFSSGTSNIK